MRHLKFEHSTGPVTESFVLDYEALIGAKLPVTYRNFLLATNGGTVSSENNMFAAVDNPEFPLDPERGSEGFMVDEFYELTGTSYPALSLSQAFQLMRERIPLGTVPIARDPFGNCFLLGISGAFFDKVLFWDHEIEGLKEPDSSFRIARKLSETFESFLNALEPIGH